ncbi:MAG: hypothetical protein Q8937_21560, partial [Bacteroidota bacterium]|nr:hypothetical protein [Bacteroidota bacterium]
EKRRPLPLFWLFVLVGGMLIGAGGTWFFFGRNQSAGLQSSAATPTSGGVSSSTAAPSSIAVPSSAPLSTAPTSGAPSSTGTRRPTGVPFAAPSLASNSPASHAAATPPAATSQTIDVASPHITPDLTVGVTPGGTPGDRPDLTPDGSPDLTPDIIPDGGLSASPVRAGLAGIRSYMTPHTILAPAIAASPATSPATAKQAVIYKRPVWQAGFAGGAGISALGQTGYRQLVTTAPSSLNLNTPSVQYGGMSQSYAYIKPRISPDLSFWAGVFIQKPIGRRVSMSAGLNLHYYSTRMTTGQQVTGNSNYITPSLFYSSVVTSSARAYPYYPPGDNYTYLNRYYFLEVPLSIQWQFNRNDRLPLFLEGGVSAARLMSVNALYYNESSGVYYKFGSPASNPLQLFSSAAVLAGLRVGSTRVQFGPEVQYGLTSLTGANAGPAQHLLFGGLKLIVIPGWK